jgi:hypothetical protein
MQQEFNLILCVNVSNTSCHHVTWIKKSQRCHATRNVHKEEMCMCSTAAVWKVLVCVEREKTVVTEQDQRFSWW